MTTNEFAQLYAAAHARAAAEQALHRFTHPARRAATVTFAAAVAEARWWLAHPGGPGDLDTAVGLICATHPLVRTATQELPLGRGQQVMRWVADAWPAICTRAETLTHTALAMSGGRPSAEITARLLPYA